MGQVAAMNSMDRVLEKYASDLKGKTLAMFQELNPILEDISVDCDLVMSDDCYGIDVIWKIAGAAEMEGLRIQVRGEDIKIDFGLVSFHLDLIETWNIDRLAEMYPDCDIGY